MYVFTHGHVGKQFCILCFCKNSRLWSAIERECWPIPCSEYFLTCFCENFTNVKEYTYPQTQKHKHPSTNTQAQHTSTNTQTQTHKHSRATQMCTLLVLARTVHRLGRGRSVRQPLCSRIIIHPCLHLSLSLPFS